MQYKEGQQVEIIDNLYGHTLQIGSTVIIDRCIEEIETYVIKCNDNIEWYLGEEELKAIDSVETDIRHLLQSILDNAVHIGGTDYRISEDVINKIREVLK